jgi:hypothetical protein
MSGETGSRDEREKTASDNARQIGGWQVISTLNL